MAKVRLSLKRRDDGWWVTNIPSRDVPENGPYNPKQLAIDAKDGLERFYAAHPEYADEIVQQVKAKKPASTQSTLF